MSEYNAKNYTEQGGEVTHIGGKLVFDERMIHHVELLEVNHGHVPFGCFLIQTIIPHPARQINPSGQIFLFFTEIFARSGLLCPPPMVK